MMYGLLYNFKTACKACPKGWELPTNVDWESLLNTEDSTSAIRFKDIGFWEETNNTNTSKFSARPAGFGNNGGYDNAFGKKTLFWSKTQSKETIWTYIFELDKDDIRKADQHGTYAFSVRCIKKL